MRIEVRDVQKPRHWRVLEAVVSKDRQMRRDVTMVVDRAGFRFINDEGSELPIEIPQQHRVADLTHGEAQLELLVWLWWTFGEDQVANQDNAVADEN